MAVLPEADEAEQLVHLGFERASLDAAQAPDQLQILAAAEVRIQVRLLGHVADASLVGFEVAADFLSVELDVARGGLRRPMSILTVVLFPAPLGPR